MDSPSGFRRSHFGCTRCKQRRQKCDEQKPSCGRCSHDKSSCCYSMTLKWGGRIPRRVQQSRRSRQALPTAPAKLGSTKLRLPPGHATSSSSLPIYSPELVTKGIQPLSRFPDAIQSSIHYFIHRASHVTSAHARIQERICGIVLPLALETSSLLYATVALSDLHRSTWQSTVHDFDLDKHLSGIVALSLRSLRDELQSNRHTSRYAMLVAIRTLCIFEIHSGRAAPDSWRAHMEGAKALLAVSRSPTKTDSTAGPGDPQWLVERWFASIESFTALTNRGLASGQLGAFGSENSFYRGESEGQYLDIYSAYTPSLNDVFKEIGAAAWERRKLSSSQQGDSSLTEEDLKLEAACLEDSVRSRLGQSKFDPAVEPFLTKDEVEQFAASDDAYRYTALCHLQRHVRQLSRSSVEVQQTVKKIIESIRRIKPSSGLSPWVMATTPLFAAGCAALGEDRQLVRMALQDLYRSLQIRNVQRCIHILEMLWESDAEGDTDLKTPTMGQDWDFIPY